MLPSLRQRPRPSERSATRTRPRRSNNRSPRRLPRSVRPWQRGWSRVPSVRSPKVRMPRRSPFTTKSARRMSPSSGFWKRRAARSLPVSRTASPCCSSSCVRPKSTCFRWRSARLASFPGRKVDETLAAELDRATPERAALVIGAMADRKETVILSAVLKAAAHGPREVRLAAVKALGGVGNASCLSRLLETALESDTELAATGKQALADLPGQDVDKDIVARLHGASGEDLSPVDRVGRRAPYPGGSRSGEGAR